MLLAFLFSLILSNQNPSVLTVPVEVPTLRDIAIDSAEKYKLPKARTELMLKVIGCESHWDTHAVSRTGDYGISQIHLAAWGITKEQAFDPAFSLDFMAHQFSLGHEHYWTCARLVSDTAP